MNQLKKIQKRLNNYFTYFKTEDVLIVSYEKTDLPFCYLINDDIYYPGVVLVSFSVDFCEAASIAQFILDINKNSDILITESFYIAQSGVTHWGEDAFKMFEVDHFIDLNECVAISEALN